MDEPPVPIRCINFVQAVLERPQMYTAYGSYNEVIAFIDGYHVGHLQRGTHWFEFGQWLQEWLGEAEGRLLVRFRQGFADDFMALQRLKELYDAFLHRPTALEALPDEETHSQL